MKPNIPMDPNELHMRTLALEHAVDTHGDTIEERQITDAAVVYLHFLKTGETMEEPEPLPADPKPADDPAVMLLPN